jgi:predicted phage terminase large subunit-like protein
VLCFDELTEFREEDYLFLFSRLRRAADSRVPLRTRAASNPGNAGHGWVKQRFLSGKAQRAGRLFVPARLADNPHLDQAGYIRSLQNLPAFERRQLLEGDWSEFQGNHFHPGDWPRYQSHRDAYVLDKHRLLRAEHVWRFAVVDPATEAKKSADYTAILVCGVTPDGRLLILDVTRRQLDVGDVIPTLAGVCRAWYPLSFVGMESIAFQKLLVAEASKHRDIPPVRELKPQGKGKLARAVAAITKAERGEIYVPDEAGWLDEFVTELASFAGANDPCDDQTDCLAYAVLAVNRYQPAGAGEGPVLLTAGWQNPFPDRYGRGW